MMPIPLTEVVAKIQAATEAADRQSVEDSIWPALDQFPEVGPLWFFAGVYCQRYVSNSLAAACFKRAYELDANPITLSNLGACYRYNGQVEAARTVFLKAIDRDPKDVNALINMCGTYVNEGDPLAGIEYGERALQVDGDKAEGKFNLALLHLEAGHLARGFDLYTAGKHRHREERDYYTPETEPALLTPERHAMRFQEAA